MDVAGIQLVQTTPGGVQKNCSAVVPEQQTQGLIEDSFATGERDTGSIPGKSGAWKSTVLKAAVGAAVGAGVLALSGGSVLAAIGMSAGICAGLGALKGLSHAILGNFSFNGHSGAGSALDRNPVAMSLLMGTIGAAKGAAEGLVLGGLAGFGFGPLGGAVAGAAMPSLEKIGWHMFEKHQHNHQGMAR